MPRRKVVWVWLSRSNEIRQFWDARLVLFVRDRLWPLLLRPANQLRRSCAAMKDSPSQMVAEANLVTEIFALIFRPKWRRKAPSKESTAGIEIQQFWVGVCGEVHRHTEQPRFAAARPRTPGRVR